MLNTKTKFILSLLASSVLLSGCFGAAVGLGAAVGVSAAKEGGLQTSIKDEAIRIKVSDLWFKRSTDMFRKLNLTVNQGRVLVTGVVENPEDRVEAIRLAWQPKGVKQVINEVRIGKSDTVGSYAQDTWIAGQLRTRLTFEKYVQSINYSIEVVQGTVYLMGVAQDQQELDRVINISRKIKGVKEVISYVKLAGIEPDIGATEMQGNTIVAEPVPLTPVDMQNDMTSVPSNPPQDSYQGNSTSSGMSSIQSEVLPP